MKLACDASALVAEALRRRRHHLIAHPDLELYIAEPMWSEVTHELARRVRSMVQNGGLSAEAGQDLLDEAHAVLARTLHVVSEEGYAAYEAEARRRVPRDPNDWPTVALALALDAAIWTHDYDFFGCGVAVWTTETLLAQLVA